MRLLGASRSLAIPAAHRKQTTRLIQHNPFENRGGLFQIIFGRVQQRSCPPTQALEPSVGACPTVRQKGLAMPLGYFIPNTGRNRYPDIATLDLPAE